MELSVMVPARNEADVLAACLESLLNQPQWAIGRDWELIVVDDNSTDRTREIALSFVQAEVLDPAPLADSWTGKANALWTAANEARGEWFLFTDADTIHEPGKLQKAIEEARNAGAAMLSYSSRQLVSGFWQRVVMPLIFAELTRTYPTNKIADPASPIAAANGQFLLVRRDAYFAAGGHAAVASSLLEDVDLARLIKRLGFGIRLRYAPDAVSTRMYRSTRQMIEGWTKNLALLFPYPLRMASKYALESLVLITLPLAALFAPLSGSLRIACAVFWMAEMLRVFFRSLHSGFSSGDCAVTVLGMPLFAWLLVRSWFTRNVLKRTNWKGRAYATTK